MTLGCLASFHGRLCETVPGTGEVARFPVETHGRLCNWDWVHIRAPCSHCLSSLVNTSLVRPLTDPAPILLTIQHMCCPRSLCGRVHRYSPPVTKHPHHSNNSPCNCRSRSWKRAGQNTEPTLQHNHSTPGTTHTRTASAAAPHQPVLTHCPC
jgi:hypothetical protein